MRKPISGVRLSGVILTIVALFCVSQGNGVCRVRHGNGAAKNIILFIGDGMDLADEIAASRYLYGRDDGLVFHAFPHQSHMTTWDVTTYNKHAVLRQRPLYDPEAFDPRLGYDPDRGGDHPYPLQRTAIDDSYFIPPDGSKPAATDSAAAATAWATGYKTDGRNIAWRSGDPAGGLYPTIAEIMRESKGASIGIVTTTPISHATPAAHVSHNVDRDNYRDIANEILETTRPDVVIGGGHPLWARDASGREGRFMSLALYEKAKSGALVDYVFAERWEDHNGAIGLLNAAQDAVARGKKLCGLYGGSNGEFESLAILDAPGTPFIARASNKDPRLMDATLAALAVLGQDPDGFLVMIEQGSIDGANHANDYAGMVGAVLDLEEAVRAAMRFVERPDDAITWDNTLLLVTSDHANGHLRLNPDKRLAAGDLPRQEKIPDSDKPAYTYPDRDVTYRAVEHTNELVRVYAMGVNAELLHNYEGRWYPGRRILDNTQLFQLMVEAAGMPLPPLSHQMRAAPSRASSSLLRSKSARD